MIQLKSCRYFSNTTKQYILSVDSFTVAKGERIFIVGPSGSGKTTLLKALSGLLPGHSGQLYIDGISISSSKKTLREKKISYLSQDSGLWPHLTCFEHISFVITQGTSLSDPEGLYWLDLVGLQHLRDRRPYQLSGGEKKRLALARALAPSPQYLFLDEPFANIDLVLANDLMGLIDEQHQIKQFSLVKVTHHTLGFDCNDTIICVLHKGHIVQIGRLAEIADSPANDWIKKWLHFIKREE